MKKKQEQLKESKATLYQTPTNITDIFQEALIDEFSNHRIAFTLKKVDEDLFIQLNKLFYGYGCIFQHVYKLDGKVKVVMKK